MHLFWIMQKKFCAYKLLVNETQLKAVISEREINGCNFIINIHYIKKCYPLSKNNILATDISWGKRTLN